jgi:alpha-L-fucosidase
MIRHVWRRIVLAAAAIAVLAAPAANAELLHPRQEFLRNSTAGLFLHRGMFTAPLQTGVTDYRQYCANWEQAVDDGGWNADDWVDEAQKLHARYIVLATFHSRLGYARPWPSEIPGSCATKRDILGELIGAASTKGLRVILYMTDDPQWHNEQGFETLDSAAYSAYKGHAVDLTTRDGFGEYSYDLFFEAMRKYPGLAGFWIDNDNAYWERNHLYEQIRELRPSWTLSNNNEDTPIMDMVSHEQKTGMTPPYDYPQAVWTPMPRLTEGEWKLPEGGTWWYDGRDRDVDYGLTLGRLISNAGSSIKSLMDETAQIGGRLPSKQAAFNDFADGYLDEIWGSISGTEGGGYMYGGMQPGDWNDGAHGVVTVKQNDERVQFIHAITPPTSGSTLRVRDTGYRVKRVTDFRTGDEKRFSQSGGYLTIDGIETWDQYDTVLEVETTGRREGYYPQQSITATATAAAPGFPASNLVDDSYLNYWDANRTVPVSIDLDLGEQRPVTSLAVNQREWSPTHNRQTFGRQEDSTRIKDYTVSVSDDGASWTQVEAATLPSVRGIEFIDLDIPSTRYVRLTVNSTWGSPTVTSFFNKLAIDEMYVVHKNVTGSG